MNRVVVTGGSGFVGRHCLPRLTEAGYEVHVLSRQNRQENIGHWHQVDLMDPLAVSNAMRKIRPSHLLHLAWITDPGKYLASPVNLNWYLASLHLVRTFREAGGERAVVTGSCAEYDWKYGWCREELTPLNPSSLYGQYKRMLQRHLADDAKRTGLSWGWGRLFFIYGPNASSARIPGVIIDSLIKNKKALCSHGHQIRDFLHVEDAASALIRLLNSEYQGAVNIASGEPITVREIVLKFANHFGRQDLIQFGAIPTVADEPLQLVADVRRLKNALTWSPAYNLTTGLNATIEWNKGVWRESRI